MNTITQNKQSSYVRNHMPNLIAGLLNSILITLVLVYIDGGLNNFDWMQDAQNLIMCGLYIIIIFPSQYLMSKYLFNNLHGYKRVAFTSFLGFPITLFLLWLLFKKWG